MKRVDIDGNKSCGCNNLSGSRNSGDAAATPDTAKGFGDVRCMIAIPGGMAQIGTDHPLLPMDGEGPRRMVKIAPFGLDACTVSNERFARFKADTGFQTDAERYGWSFVFAGHVAGGSQGLVRVQDAPWWCRVDGARWDQPEGPGSSIAGRMDHPVVHVSHRDALAFAAWAGGRLPSEAEWEHGARGGRPGALFPWGDAEPDDLEFLPCNIWQGTFPEHNSNADGYAMTAPVRSFAPNGHGLFNMSGNVWEWSADLFRIRSLKRPAQEINAAAAREGRRVLKGGSFLCHRSYCYRYRIAARIGNSPDTSTSHTGFRLAYSL